MKTSLMRAALLAVLAAGPVRSACSDADNELYLGHLAEVGAFRDPQALEAAGARLMRQAGAAEAGGGVEPWVRCHAKAFFRVAYEDWRAVASEDEELALELAEPTGWMRVGTRLYVTRATRHRLLAVKALRRAERAAEGLRGDGTRSD